MYPIVYVWERARVGGRGEKRNIEMESGERRRGRELKRDDGEGEMGERERER